MNNDSTTDKVDYSISDRNRVFALFSYGKYANPIVGSLTPISTSTLPVPYTDGRGVIEYATLGQIHDSYSISPTLVNEFSVSASRLFIPLTSNTASGNYPIEGGSYRAAPRHRQYGLSGYLVFRQQRARKLGWDQLPCV